MPAAIAPIAIGALAGGLSAHPGALGALSFLKGALLGGGLSALSVLLAPKPPNFEIGASRADTRHTVRSAVSPARWIVGRARVGGVMVFYKETGAIGEGKGAPNDVHVAMVLSEGACDAIEKVWADGEEIPLSRNGTRLDAGGAHAGKMTLHEYFAADGTQGDSLRAAAGGDWTEAHKLKGLSWVHVHLHQPDYGSDGNNRFWSRFPEINFLVRGVKITWPGQATPQWTENSAALRCWWLRTRRGLPAAAIDTAGFRAAYSLCEQEISHSLPAGYEDYAASCKRYAVNGVIHADDDPERVEAELDFAWAGWAVELDGVHHFRPGADRPIAGTVTPDDIIAVEGIRPAPALQDRINAATVSLVQSREHDWLEASLPEFADESGRRRDGERLPKDLGRRAFVADPVAGGRLLAIALRRARAGATFTYRLKPGAGMKWLTVRPSDWVTVTDPEHGLEEFQALVTRTVVNPDWSVTLDLTEQPSGIYADTLVLPPLKSRAIAIPHPRDVPAVTGLAAAHGFTVSRDGTVVWHIDASWDDAPYHARLRVTDEDGNLQAEARADGTSQRFTVNGPSAYTVTARHVTPDGFASPAASVEIAFDWSGVPVPAPVVLSAEQYGLLLQIVAAPVANRDVAGIELRYSRGPIDGTGALAAVDEAGWLAAPRADAALTSPISGDAPLVANAVIPGTGRYRLFARLFNRTGNYGPVVELGTLRLVVPAIETLNPQSWPRWLGTLNNLFLWPHDNEYRLYPDYDNRNAVTRGQWDGREGWPFGPVEGYGAPMTDDSTWYETQVLDLGEPSNVDVVADIGVFEPPGAAQATETGHTVYAYHGLTPERTAMTQVALSKTEPTRINALRYIAFRVHLTRWRGAALTRFAPEIRRLN